jgi:hypothetical protein
VPIEAELKRRPACSVPTRSVTSFANVPTSKSAPIGTPTSTDLTAHGSRNVVGCGSASSKPSTTRERS